MPEELKAPGLSPDPRTPEEKAKDYIHEEVAPQAVPLNWDRGPEGAPQYSERDQDGSGSCVAQATATALEVLTGKIISAHPTYRRRANFPLAGMWLQDAGNIIKKLGTTTEDLDPSQRMNEDQMNVLTNVPTPINGYLYAFPNIKDIDQIAEAIEVRKECLITIASTLSEYAYSDKPVADLTATTLNCLHCIAAVWYFKDKNGEKCLLIKESWGPNNVRYRTFTESFIKARGTAAMYYLPPVPPITPQKPVFRFTSQLQYGQSNYSIKVLQDILKYENLFPINVTSSGLYWEITRKAVLAFQFKYNVASPLELNTLKGKIVGPKTIKKLNELYGK